MSPPAALAGLYERARHAAMQGRSIEAKALCQQALRLDPRHLPSLLLMGGLEGSGGNFKAANRAFEQARALAPDDPMIHFNLGLCAQHLRRPTEGRRRYEQAIALKPDFAEAHSNLAATLKELGRGDEAADHYRQALRLKPGLPSACNNLGILLIEAGQFTEAQACFTQALATEPNFAEALNNLGSVLLARGKPVDAIQPLRKALALRPDYAEAHRSLGRAFRQLGRLADAATHFEHCLRVQPSDTLTLIQYGQTLAEDGQSTAALGCFERAIAADGEGGDGIEAMTAFLAGFDPPADLAGSERLARSVERCLATRSNDHQLLSGIGISIVFTPTVRAIVDAWLAREATGDATSMLAVPFIKDIAQNPILRLILQRTIVTDLFVERFLTQLRRIILVAVSSDAGPDGHRGVALDLAYLLARQAFLNEYVWPVDAVEENAVLALRRHCIAAPKADPAFELRVLTLACYSRLGEGDAPRDWLDAIKASSSKRLQDIYRVEVEHFAVEAEVAAAMPVLTVITAGTSRLVQAQYESYPYPRWQSLPRTKPMPFLAHLRQVIWPHWPEELPDLVAPRILIAGCGTGHQAVLAAARYRNASILAVDLSRASLAYAKRMADTLGIGNIRFAQGDILDVDRIGEVFDAVECVGVLHHMADPAAGLSRLVAATRPGGLIRVGLYSEIARRNLASLRTRLDAPAGQVETAAEIRALRTRAIQLMAEGHQPEVAEYLDFYSTSMVKDLLFHVCELEFSIPGLATLFEGAGLAFLGFEVPDRRLKQAYLDRNPGDPNATDLAGWHAFEQAYPKTFRSMYIAWLRRPPA